MTEERLAQAVNEGKVRLIGREESGEMIMVQGVDGSVFTEKVFGIDNRLQRIEEELARAKELTQAIERRETARENFQNKVEVRGKAVRAYKATETAAKEASDNASAEIAVATEEYEAEEGIDGAAAKRSAWIDGFRTTVEQVTLPPIGSGDGNGKPEPRRGKGGGSR